MKKSFSKDEFAFYGTGGLVYKLNNGVTINRNSFIKEMKQFDEVTGIAKNYYKGSDGSVYEVVAEPVNGFYHTTAINKVDYLEYDRNMASRLETEFDIAEPQETANAFGIAVKDGEVLYEKKESAELRLFLNEQDSVVSDLRAPEQNAIYLALYEKLRSDGIKDAQVFETIKDIMQSNVKELEKYFTVDYIFRERKEPGGYVKFIPQIVIPGSDLDIKTYLDEETFKRSVNRLLEDEVIRVERLRGSVTQGEAAIYCNGKKIVQYGDKICLRCKDGNWLDAMADKKILDSSLEQGEYGPMIGDYRSVKPDHLLVASAIVTFPKEINKSLLGDVLEQTHDTEKSGLDSVILSAQPKTFKKENSRVIRLER